MTLIKESLITSIHSKLNITKSQSAALVESLLEIIKSTLASGEDVLISGFGKFSVKEKKDRSGRNPQTGEDLILDAKLVVRFKCSGRLREKVDGER